MGLTAIALATLAAQATTPDALPPAGKWTVEYNEGDCTMSRSFGSAAAPVTFAFQPSPTGSWGEVLLLMPAAGRKGVRRGDGSVVLRPSGLRFEARFAVGPIGGDRRGGRFAATQAFWDALPAATSLSMELKGEPPFAIALGSMSKPLAAGKACGDDLLRSWGVEPTTVARYRSGQSPAQYFSSDSYPPEAIRAGAQGRSVALVTVDRDGMPSDCRTVQSSKSITLDRTTCAVLMKRARFEPAAAGETKPRFSVLPVRWESAD